MGACGSVPSGEDGEGGNSLFAAVDEGSPWGDYEPLSSKGGGGVAADSTLVGDHKPRSTDMVIQVRASCPGTRSGSLMVHEMSLRWRTYGHPDNLNLNSNTSSPW